ncbi:peptidase domain-containing ABC transporter [Oecophyllibacter saccharovorans]|uniref:Peptidase domain-containing ABC transporter n=1 Tax=Oecophyllibacter saccharovorans TaxID=2558360 RepID=A0A506UR34_9PROT|nr:peptidase domain-containing ABC transporter [Oecophyllibacter saccharovorans]TPW35817.1 peptidase domain-containing ABC transporter [Oecophyllibacter saccharovorans]
MLKPIVTSFRKKIPTILQSENAECGLACLAMILNAHGHLIDISTLRRQAGLSGSGLTLRTLIHLAGRFDLQARPLKLDLDSLSKLSVPCILHWDFNHFVVLVKAGDKYVEIIDPGQGPRKLTYPEVSKHFTGVALELTPTAKFEKRDDRHLLSIRDMFRHVGALKGTLLALGALSLGLEVIALINPMLSQVIIDEVLTTSDHSLLWTIAVGMGILLLVQAVISTFRSWTVMLMSTRISIQWNVSLLSHLLGLPQDYFSKRGAGDILSRFGSLGAIQQAFTTDVVQVIMDGLMAVGMLVMIIIYGQWLALVVGASSLIDIMIRVIYYGPYREMSQEVLVHDAARQGQFLETLRGIRSIKLLGLEEKRKVGWVNKLIDSINAKFKIQRYDLIFSRANDIIFGFDRLLMLILGASMVLDGSMTVGVLVAFLSYRDQFSSRLGNLISAAFKIRNLKVHTDRLSDIALAKSETNEGEVDLVPSDGSPGPDGTSGMKLLPQGPPPEVEGVPLLECRNLGYRYGKEDSWVFKDLNLTIEAGESLAITGPSGCGKSTLLSILMGMSHPEEGEIYWNGQALGPNNIEAYRSQIAGVLQDDILLSGSIAENIAGFADNIDMPWVEECAKNAQILDDIKRMPMGFETLVGEMGSTLSGGQRQRMILARALYRRPKILFLDEATSNLDSERERKISSFLDELKITRVIVAHRLETIENASVRLNLGALVGGGAAAQPGANAPRPPAGGAPSPQAPSAPGPTAGGLSGSPA